MKYLYETTYLDHKIALYLKGKSWYCTASKDGEIIHKAVCSIREQALDLVQYELDLSDYASDKSVQISNLPFHDWLEERKA